MEARTPVLAHLTWKRVKEERYDVAVLPWGATEAHNTHLPYATDTIQAEAVAAESARIASAAGAREWASWSSSTGTAETTSAR